MNGGKFLKGMTAGALIGAAAGMFFMPEMDRSTKKKIRRSARTMQNAASEAYDNVRGWMR